MTEPNRFGFWTLTFLVVANMVGAGVFTTSGFTLAELGSPQRVVLAWVVGGAIALAGAFSYGRLIRAMPESGGEYLFLSRAAHPLLGFIAGWVSLIAGFTGAIAFAATAFESYLAPERIRPDWLPGDAIAIASILVCGLFHGVRAKAGIYFQNAFVGIKLGLLTLFLLMALVSLLTSDWMGGPVDRLTETGPWSSAVAFAGALVWISLSYSGFNAAVYVAEEARESRKTIPKALLVGTMVVTLLYVFLNAVFVFAPPPEAIEGRADVAAIAAEWIGGDRIATAIRGVICLALLTSVSSMMMAAPRVYAKMAADGFMPRSFHFTGEAPRVAIALQAVLAIVFVLISTLQDLLSYLGLTLSLCAALSVGCLFLPSVRKGEIWRWSHLLAAAYIFPTLLAAGLMTLGNPWQLLGTVLTFSAGAVVYLVVGLNPKKAIDSGGLS
ncbi:MAG: amino acid permease [Candidatus Omnitrophica bacterium]|nr:amino acid permease [Candidatus Omnitrophota bacterium]